MMRGLRPQFIALATAVAVVSVAAPIDRAHAVRCLKVLTREGTKTYCGGGYVDLHGNVYEKRKKTALAPAPGPQPGRPVQVNQPVNINATSHHGGGRH